MKFVVRKAFEDVPVAMIIINVMLIPPTILFAYLYIAYDLRAYDILAIFVLFIVALIQTNAILLWMSRMWGGVVSFDDDVIRCIFRKKSEEKCTIMK